MAESSVPTTLDDDGYDDLDESDRQLIDDVREYGFHQIHVAQAVGDPYPTPEWGDVPNWTYTIGFYASAGHPELVMFSLDHETAASVAWDIFRAVQSGRRFEPYTIYDDVLPTFEEGQCSFEPVSPEWAPSLFGAARWFYKRQDFPVLQYLWPDKAGRFPWDDNADPVTRSWFPRLTESPEYEDAPPPQRTSSLQ